MISFALIIAIAFLLSIASITAFAIGANDSTMASMVSAKVLSLRSAVILGSVLLIIGAVILGQGVSTTIGAGLTIQTPSIDQVLVISCAMIIWMVFSSYYGYPISATHSIVGSVIGIGLFIEIGWYTPFLRWDVILIIIAGWILSPIFSLMIAFFLQRYVLKKFLLKDKGLDEVQRREKFFGLLLAVMVIIICLSRGGNDVAKAVGLLTTSFIGTIGPTLLLLLGGVGMAIGLFVLGRRVVYTVGIELTELRPSTSFSSATAGAIVLLSGTLLGIPLAATHVIITSIIGAGIANQVPPNKTVVKKLIFTSILTVPVSAALSISIWVSYQFLVIFLNL